MGISNEASDPGRFLVWVTDLATGRTADQDGPPYGYPVEFAHPDEREGDGEPGSTEMVFTFLDAASRPPGVGTNTRFYAWASVEEDGALVAWDYAPNAGWIGTGAPSGVADEPEVAVVPPGVPDDLISYPECWAQTFAFIGEGTLRGLGLDTATRVPPPDIDRAAKIWVTGDLMPNDPGPEGGPIQRTRMLCFEFADGTGGSGWPVDPDWRPPADQASASSDVDSASLSQPILVLVILVVVLLIGGLLAFRRR